MKLKSYGLWVISSSQSHNWPPMAHQKQVYDNVTVCCIAFRITKIPRANDWSPSLYLSLRLILRLSLSQETFEQTLEQITRILTTICSKN